MSMSLNRDRLFALLGALEEDLRDLVEAYLLVRRSEGDVLGGAHEKALDRYTNDPARDLTGSRLVDYLDLGDEIEILLRNRRELPPDTGDALTRAAPQLGDLLPIRNRVMHRRPLLPDDLDRAQEALTHLSAEGFEGPSVRELVERLRRDPTWAPVAYVQEEQALVLNNLPLVDFDETGLIGRRKELTKLTKQVMALGAGRSPVLTVVGPGGIGKTALVLQALHDLVNDPACPYDLVSWVSLKSERLTANGVEAIRDAVISVDQAVPALIEALNPGFEGSAAQLAEALEGLTTLLVIDNLETVSGSEVLDFVDALPESVSYLLTSREGLGQLERRFPLGPLEERAAVSLLRKLFQARDIDHLSRMDEAIATDLVRQLGATPLGLKWFVGGIEAGKDPADLVAHRGELVRYCVENVFASLDHSGRDVAGVLHVLGRPATTQEVHLFLPDLPTDALRASLQALDRRMLIHRDIVAGSLTETFEASAALSDFVRLSGALDPEEARRVRDTEDSYRLAEERHRLDAASDPLRPNIIQGGDEHRATVLLLRDAMQLSKRGDVSGALELVADAEALDAEFWEIHRVRGFILSSDGVVDGATAAFSRAVELAPTAVEAAAVQYFFAGHLTRRARDARKAVPIARAAHYVLMTERTAIELGKALTYTGEFVEAEVLLRQALTAEDLRTRLIGQTLLVECLKRRAEAEASAQRQPAVAFQTLVGAARSTADALAEGLVDRKLLDVGVDCVSEALHVACSCQADRLPVGSVGLLLATLTDLGLEARQSRSFGYATGHARALLRAHPHLADVAALVALAHLDPRQATGDSAGESVAPQRTDGVIRAWKSERSFGFIESDGYAIDAFFNRSALGDSSGEIHLEVGGRVSYERRNNSDGRVSAVDVLLEHPGPDSMFDRRLLVLRLHESGACLFASEVKSGATVFVGRHALRDVSDWERMEVGVELNADLEVDESGRFRALPRSVRQR